MTTPKTLPITVTLNTPQVMPLRKEVAYEKHPNGYRCIRYGRTISTIFEPKHLNTSLIDLKELVPAPQKMDFGSFRLNNPPIDPIKAVEFIERWGVIGFARSERRKTILEVIMNLPMERAHKDFSASVAILRQAIPHPYAFIEMIDKTGVIFPEIENQLDGIVMERTIPWSWVEEDLRILAKMSRLFSRVFTSQAIERGSVQLTQNNKKRIAVAWGNISLSIPESEDPGDPKYSIRPEWTEAWRGARVGLDDEIEDFEVPILDGAEGVLGEFEHSLNSFLVPMTSKIVRFDTKQVTYSYETALSSFFIAQLKSTKPRRTCSVCREIYIPVYQVSDEKPRFCSERCARRERQRRFRENKKGNISDTKIKKEK